MTEFILFAVVILILFASHYFTGQVEVKNLNHVKWIAGVILLILIWALAPEAKLWIKFVLTGFILTSIGMYYLYN